MSKKYSFLFIGDSTAEQFLTQSIIELDQLPIEATFMSDPEEAFLYLSRQERSCFPDVILADTQLPLYSGYEFAMKYQSVFFYSYPKTLLYITSAYLSAKGGKEIAANNAITDFLFKPFSRDHFVNHILGKLEVSADKEQPFMLKTV